MASKNTGKSNKLVRDSFTIPKVEYLTIDALKTRAIAMGTSVKKSELLRAGLMVLKGMSDAAFKTAVAAVPTLKTGRPSAEVTPPKATASVAKPAAKVVLKKAAKPTAKPATKVEPAAKVAPKAVEKKVVAKKAAAPAARKPVAKTVAPKPKASAPAKAAVPAKQTVAVAKPVATSA
jgi:outer membrane biosynthesis protein TonB